MQIQSYTSTYNYRNTAQYRPGKKAYSTPLKRDAVAFGFNPMGVITDGLAHGMGRIGSTKPAQKLVDFLKDRNYQQHLAAFVGVMLSSFYMLDTARSKTIEKDQKMPLIVNQAAVCALSTMGAYTLDNYLDKHIANFTEKFNIANISDNKTRKMFAKLYDNPEFLDVINRRLNNAKGEIETLDKEIANKLFSSNINTEQNLAKLIDKSKADKIATQLIDKIKELPATIVNESGKTISKENAAKDLFLKEINNSKTLRTIYKELANDFIKNISNETVLNPETDKIVKRFKTNTKYIDNLLRIRQLKESFKILDKMFEYNNGIDKKLKSLVKEGKADETVKNLVENIAKLGKVKGMDKADKAKDLFMNVKKNSQILTNIFNRQSMTNAIKLTSNNDTKLSTLMNGFKIAKSLMIFAMIYRFIAPVIATPIANSISERIETKKKAAKA